MTEGRARIFYVGVDCDRCGRQQAGDFAATSQRAAEDGLRDYLGDEKGWRCDRSGDWCPRCKETAPRVPAEPVKPSTDEAPAPRRTGPPEVEALRAIDLLIGNAETVDADTLGRVRGIVLDTLNAWTRSVEAEPGLDPAAVAAAAAEIDGLWT